MKNAHFGFGTFLGAGTSPSVGVNRHGNVVMVHQLSNGVKHYRVGRLSQATIHWGETKPAGGGETPRVALNNKGIAVEVHRNPQHRTLYCRAGRLGIPQADEVSWPDASRYAEGDNRHRPAVALNDSGLVVEMHEVRERVNRRELFFIEYNVTSVTESAGQLHLPFRPENRRRLGEATMPAVALDNHGTVIHLHRYPYGNRDRRLFCQVGRIEGTTLQFLERTEVILPGGGKIEGHYPSVAITDDGLVTVVFRAKNRLEVFELTGELNANRTSVSWNRCWKYDEGTSPSVAAAGGMAVEVHEHRGQILFSSSLITNRASWMHDRLDSLGKKRLRNLVLPASHDAGMYKRAIPSLARNQNLSIYEQLVYGARYFDLRPMWGALGKGPWLIHHGGVPGPSVQTVLNDVRQFAQNHQELVILKFSHFRFVDNNSYQRLARQIVETIGEWLVKPKANRRKRFADMTLNEYIQDRTAVLVVVDADFAVDNPVDGIWVYRNWSASAEAARRGDLRVYDWWPATEDFSRMRADQLRKFANYSGRMQNDPELPCDLFLLSWALTPQGLGSPSPWALSRLPNIWLGSDSRDGNPPPSAVNEHGRVANLLSVDFVETARVTDVALFHNGEQVG